MSHNTTSKMTTLSMTGDFVIIDEDNTEVRLYRELVIEQDIDGSWLVYVVDPAAMTVDGEMTGSASVPVEDEAGAQLLSDIVAMVKVTGPEKGR